MFELMYEARGVGLAANQVDLPLRMFLVNLESDPDQGEELVFVNPVLSRPKGSEETEEGCLSLPGLYGLVRRPKQIRVNAYSIDGSEIQADVDGLLARVVQHETDHLDGVLFIDRMSESARRELKVELDEFETVFRSRRATGEAPVDDEIAARLAVWEGKYCM
jgi:peptide deformylase